MIAFRSGVSTILALIAWALLAGPAAAEWKRAESDHFIVYSQQNEHQLRQYVRKLEIFDHVLRVRMGLPVDEPVARKLPVYIVGHQRTLRQVRPDLPERVVGFYAPTTEDIFAVATENDDMFVLLHEYFHHFSLQIPGVRHYPAWLIEGLAEYYMTADISERAVRIGGYNEGRVAGLQNSTVWIPLEDLVTKSLAETTQPSHRETYYPLAWLLTHWFLSDPTRTTQLQTYLEDVRVNGNSAEAMERATGMSLDAIRDELRRYRSLRYATYTGSLSPSQITVTRLPPSADELLLLGQRLKVGAPEDQRAAVAEQVRSIAARYPGDPFARQQLGHAELHFGDADTGVQLLTSLLEDDPENVEALQYLAAHYRTLWRDDPDNAPEHLRQARAYLARAYALDPNQYYTLYMLAETRSDAPDYPTENDLVTWDAAYQAAPQLPNIPLGYAQALIEAGEPEGAIAVLEPLANSPHNRALAETARRLIDRARHDDRRIEPEAFRSDGSEGEEDGA